MLLNSRNMEGLSTSLFLSISVLYFMVAYVKSELSDGECLSRGFNRQNLQCYTCTSLDEFELNVLKNDCLSCCQGDLTPEAANASEPEVKKYGRARLEVCG